MKNKILIIFNLILCLSLFIIFNNKEASGATVNHKSLISEYYNDGIYTKKSNIYVTEFSKKEIAKYFHGEVALDRTTYYFPNFLLMGDIDGGFDEINSGYRQKGKDMAHFKYIDGKVVDDYVVEKTNMYEFYVTLKKMKTSNYFDSSWVNGVHNVSDDDDTYLADFLAFTAPCLTDLVFNSFYITRIGMKLTITEEKHAEYGEYLSLKIYVGSVDSGKTGKDMVLSEARIYKGIYAFDEKEANSLDPLKAVADAIGSNYIAKTNVYFNEIAVERVNYNYRTDFVCFQTTMVHNNYIYRYSDDFKVNEAYYKDNSQLYKTSLLGEDLESKLNGSIDLNNITESSKTFFTLDKFNSSYIDQYGAATVKYNTNYSRDYLGFRKYGENKYHCDRPEVILDVLNIVSPGFDNGGTYMTFTHVLFELNPTDDAVLKITLIASETQWGKLIDSHYDFLNPGKFLVFAEAYIYAVDEVSISALESLFN